MKHTYTFDCFEIELPSGDELPDYYLIDLQVDADITYTPGNILAGSPSIRTIEILSYKVINAEDGNKKLAEKLDKRLHEHPDSLTDLFEQVWEEFLLMQEFDED